MTREHPRWGEFCERLGGIEGCEFGAGGKWVCAGGVDPKTLEPGPPEFVHIFSRGILLKMGLSFEQIAASLEYFCEHGGHCDCEVLFNVRQDKE
jgi:hypothetical protein